MVQSKRMMNKRLLSVLLMLAVVAVLFLPVCSALAEEGTFPDTDTPVMTAVIDGDILTIQATDASSGIAGVQVNGLLYTKLDNDRLTISLSGTLGSYEQLAIRAFDYEGNFTDPIHLQNPMYQVDVTPTPKPKPTTKPTKKPDKSESFDDTETDELLEVDTTCKPYVGHSAVYVSDWEKPTITQAVPTPTPIVQTVVETEYIPIGPGMPYKSDGNSHTLDVLYSAATNKQFITLQTKSGNTFYLVIDFDKPIDEDAELYETYFLNLVDERDLMALMSKEEIEAVPTPTPQIVYVTPEPTNVPVATAPPTEEKPKSGNQQTAIFALAILMVLGGVGAYLFVKKQKNSKRPSLNDFDMDDDTDENESNGANKTNE